MRIGGRAGGGPEVRFPGRIRLLALLTLLSFGPLAGAAAPERTRMVVMLYPDSSDGSPGNALADRGIRFTFATGSPERVEIYNEYLDISRSPDVGHRQLQAEYLRRKYAGRKVDLVIAGLSPALDYALTYRQEIFPGVPVVFCAVDRREVRARKLPPDVIGVPLTMDLAATLDAALRLHPNTRRVFVIAGKAKFDTYWEEEARQAFRAYKDRLEFTYLTGLPMNALLAEVAHLPPGSIIYYLHVFQDGTGKSFVPADALELLASAANAPVYGHVDSYVGRGLVGGRVISFEAEGKNAARLGLRILAGERPEQIAVAEASENLYLFDWRQLRRWGIDEGSLPPGSVVRYKEPGLWDLYKWHVIGVASLCVVEALLIFGLLVQRANRRRADVALRESEELFRLMADTAPVMIWVSGPDQRCTYFNKPWLDFTGRPTEAQVGDGWSEGVLAADLQGCLDTYGRAFAARQAFHMEYRLRRFDGEYRWVLDVGVPRFDADGAFKGYIGSCIDISDHKRVEGALRDSQRELRALTGRLLRAQETERRRIARELHDDLNQGLALLAVELDLLRQKPPESPGGVGGRLQELSARVKQLSSSVHDLSHQLHPSKLEQLGLVAAVRGLCEELGQGHGLRIEFSHHEVPAALPEDTALCLYRIAQEALRNVIRHSGARHARVELEEDGGAVCLRVEDDGAGFDTGLVPGKEGLGLVSMRERLRLVHGEVAIDSRPSGGTRVAVRVPLPAAGAANGALQAQAGQDRVNGLESHNPGRLP